MTVSLKIALGFLIMGLLLIASNISGFLAVSKLAGSLNHITGPLWETTDNANLVMLNVQRQMIALDEVLRTGDEAELPQLEKAQSAMAKAFQGINRSGLVGSNELEMLKPAMAGFSNASAGLIAANRDYRSAYAQLSGIADALRDMLILAEKLASQEILQQQMQGHSMLDNLTPTQNSGMAAASTTPDDYDAIETDDEEAEETETYDMTLLNAGSEARLALMSRMFLYQQFLKDSSSRDLQQNLKDTLGDLEFSIETLAESPLFQAFSVRSAPYGEKTYATVLNELLERHKQSLNQGMAVYRALLLSRKAYTEAANNLIRISDEFNRNNRDMVSNEIEHADGIINAGFNTIIITIVLALLIAAPTFLFTVRSISWPIKQVSRQMSDISNGNGDLTAKLSIKGNDEVADLAMTFNEFTENLRGIIGSVKSATDQLAASTSQVALIGDKTENVVGRQLAEIDSVATAVNELSASFQEVAENAGLCLEGTTSANQEAESGRQVVDDTVASIESLAAQVETATNVVNQLGEESTRIEAVIDVIRNISEQTNLLALNAAIEAARAGEQGRGFAVVADEVRNLAARTHESTSDIQNMIERLQNGSQQAMEVMTQGRMMATSSVEQATKAGRSLAQITDAVMGIMQQNDLIAKATQAQNKTVHEIERSVTNISSTSSETAESARQLATTTRDFTRMSNELQGLAGRFKV